MNYDGSFYKSILTLKEIDDLQIDIADTVCIMPYPFSSDDPPFINFEYDSKMRMVWFIPGREKKYINKMEGINSEL